MGTKKIICLVCWFVLAGFSCWLTQSSLHLLFPSYPFFVVWMIAIVFAFVASVWGLPLIMDSLDTNKYIENRGIRLVGGILVLIFFWLLFSMPTNTHTVFYRANIDKYVLSDVITTQGYLKQIEDNTRISAGQENLDVRINQLLNDLHEELMNDDNPGYGKECEKILKKIAEELDDSDILRPLSQGGSLTKNERNRLFIRYQNKILGSLKKKKESIERIANQTSSKDRRKEAHIVYKNLEEVRKGLETQEKDKKLDLNDVETITDIDGRLNVGYEIVNKYKNFVEFQTEEDEKNYTSTDRKNKVDKLLNVFEIWINFWTGGIERTSFFYSIFVAILVDIASFILFYVATKNEEF